MTGPADGPPDGAARPPDPMKGLRGVYAAVLTLEAVVVGLALLVLPKFGDGATPLGVSVVGGIAVLLLLGAGLQRRAWGLAWALALQVATIVAGFVLVPALGVVGILFALVWAGILWMRQDVRRRMARGELPAQQRAE